MRQVSRYHPLLVSLHWVLALLISVALALGALVMAKLPNDAPMKVQALKSHMVGGGLIVLLMLLRLAVRRRTEHPARAGTGNRFLDGLAWFSHRAFYPLVFAMGASGLWLALDAGLLRLLLGDHELPGDFWAFPARPLHYALSRVLMALIGLHVLGALYHVLVLRDGLLRRMLFGRRRVSVEPPSPRPRRRIRDAFRAT